MGIHRMEGRRRGRLLVALAAVVAAATVYAATSAGAASQTVHRADSNGLDALVLGEAGSPGLAALRDVANLDTTPRAETGELHPGRYDMLVVDGDQLTPDALRSRPALEDFVAAGKWIAAFDALPRDLNALATYTDFDVADGKGRDRSEMFVFRVAKVDGQPTVEMINSGPYAQPGTARLGDRRQDEVRQDHLRHVARIVDREITADAATGAKLETATAATPTNATAATPTNATAATLNKSTPTLSTTVKDSRGNTVDVQHPAVQGEAIHDTAVLGGKVAGSSFGEGGRVDYHFYTSGNCSGVGVHRSVGVATDGTVPDSLDRVPPAAGDYSYRATYTGNAAYNPTDSACEPFRVRQLRKELCDPLNPLPDPELQHVSFCYLDTGVKPTPDGHWTKGEKPWWVDPYSAPQQQTSTWTMNHRFDVFLNNDAANPKGDFQTVSYLLNGNFTPAVDQRFWRMTDYFTTGWDNCVPPGSCHSIPERAWWTGQIEPEVVPSTADGTPAATNPPRPAIPSTSDRLTWKGSHPQNQNAQTNYSSGEEFSVGFTGSGTIGNVSNVANVSLGLNFNWTSSKSQSYTIDDWGAENRGSGTKLHWLFAAQRPCDTKTAASDPDSCFTRYVSGPGYGPRYPDMPKTLSLRQIQVNASGRWQTRSHLTAGDGRLEFRLATPVRIVDTYCDQTFPNFCNDLYRNSAHYRTAVTGPDPADVALDASVVNPIPLKELKLSPNPISPNPANPANNKVTGTVVLERPASIPVTVKLFSNSANATFPNPLPGVNHGSQGKITINPGQSTGTFTLPTNDNKLAPGEHTTADITASYTEAQDEQLVIERPKG